MLRKKHAFTLLEIMIVIFVIGIIGSVIGYNMRGSLNEGKTFKTRHGMQKLAEILSYEIAEGVTIDEIQNDTLGVLNRSGLAKSPKKLLQDGWGNPYEISFSNDDEIVIRSPSFEAFLENNQKLLKKIEKKERNRPDLEVASIHNCRVCGLYYGKPPWGFDGCSPSHELCDCCGVEFGVGDISPMSCQEFRMRWKKKGYIWIKPSLEPDPWHVESQLRNIPDFYR